MSEDELMEIQPEYAPWIHYMKAGYSEACLPPRLGGCAACTVSHSLYACIKLSRPIRPIVTSLPNFKATSENLIIESKARP